MSMHFRAASFDPDAPIPVRHSGEGADLSPRLRWDSVPADCRSLVVLCEDIDAPNENFPHWVVYDLPPTSRELPEGLPPEGMPGMGLQGLNGFATQGWRGPMPPPGEDHRYVFSLIALRRRLDLPAGATRDEVEAALDGNVLQEDSFVGTYHRHASVPRGPARASGGGTSRRTRPAQKRTGARKR